MSRKFSVLLLLFGLLAACHAPLEPGSTTIFAPTAIALSTSTSSAVAPASLTPVTSPSSTPTPLPTHPATWRPRPTSTSTQIPPSETPTIKPTSVPVIAAPLGLIYSNGIGLPEIIVDSRPEIVHTLEPPQHQNFYYASINKNSLTDIWVEEVATGKRRNLTNTPNRYEDPPLAWPQNPDVLVFYSVLGMPDGPGYIGELTIMRTDGTGYQVVSQQDLPSPAAFSPDGRTIAYAIYDDNYPSPWIYRVGAESQRFPWKNFGLGQFKTMGFSSPSWSPDGQQLAWWMWSYDEHNKERFNGIGIFNLQSGTVTLFDNFDQIVPDGWPEAVQWSPDSKRIAFFGGRQQSEKYGNWGESGIWTAKSDGSQLRRLIDVTNGYDVCDWAWQPDGLWLAISCRQWPEALSGIWLAELETGKLLKTNLPDDAQIRGWVNP